MGGAALFVYGTLTDEERLEQLTGRRFPRRRATLEGFARVVAAHGYPTIVPQAGARAGGLPVEGGDAAWLAPRDGPEAAGRACAPPPAQAPAAGGRRRVEG